MERIQICHQSMLEWAGRLLIHAMLLNLIRNKCRKNGKKLKLPSHYLKPIILMKIRIKATKKDWNNIQDLVHP